MTDLAQHQYDVASMISKQSYKMSDAGVSQRSAAAQARWNKRDFLKDINDMAIKFKLHLNERFRLQELASYIKSTFTYEQLVNSVYADEHKECMHAADGAQIEALESQIESYKSQLQEVQERLHMAENRCEDLEQNVKDLEKENQNYQKRIDRLKHSKNSSKSTKSKELLIQKMTSIKTPKPKG